MKYLILTIFLVQYSVAYQRPPVRRAQWNQAAAIMDKMLDENVNDKGVKFLVPGVIKLVFTDCIGGCDGCVNVNQKGNEGLANTIETLEKYYNDTFIQKYFSRADFWTLTSIRALHKGISNNNEYCKKHPEVEDCVMPELPGIGWKSGRFDCNDSPYSNELDAIPDSNMDSKGWEDWWIKHFETSVVYRVSLMPFYLLGRASTEEDAESFEKLIPDGINMRIFKQLENKCLGWTQKPSSNDPDSIYQWVDNNDDVFFNVEMAPFLNFKIDPETNPRGIVDCEYKKCGNTPYSSGWISRWVYDPNNWRHYVRWSWYHITENGYRLRGV